MPVFVNSGPGLGDALMAGVQTFANARRQKKADELFRQDMEDRFKERALKNAQLAQQGIHVLDPGELPPMWLPKANAEGITSRMAMPTVPDAELSFSPTGGAPTLQPKAGTGRAGIGAANIPGRPQGAGSPVPTAPAATGADLFQQTLAANLGGMPTRGPRYDVGKGYWIDKQPQWDAQDAARANLQGEKLFEAQIQSLLADAALGRSKNLSEFNANVDIGKEGALAPIRTAQAVNTERALSPIRTEQAIATERGVGPLRSAQTVNTERQLAPIRTQQAIDTAAGVMPFKIAEAQASGGNVKPTEFSNKAALVYPRAEESAKILSAYFDRGAPARSVLGGVPLVGNYMVGDNAQKMNQAAETIASAILRLESGAAISDHEVKSYAKQFLPQPGDSQDVLEQKRVTLATQLERLRAAAQPSMGGSATVTPSVRGDMAGTTIVVNGKSFKVPN